VRMSQAQRRLALLAAALGTAGLGALLTGLPAGADTRTVTYTCTAAGTGTGAGTGAGTGTATTSPGTGTTTGPSTGTTTSPSTGTTTSPGTGTGSGGETTHEVTINLSGGTSATAQAAYPATVVIAGANPSLGATAEIPAGAQIQLVPQVSVSAAPTPPAVASVTGEATASVTTPVPSGSPLAPIPTATVTVTPEPGTTSLVLQAGAFTLRVAQPGAAAVDLYTCIPATTGNTVPAAVTAAVGTPGAATSPTTTQSPSRQPTHTVEVTVTESPANDSKVARTPAGGVATGGGGEAGPDGRTLVLAGSITLLGAAAGGLVLRRRRLARG